MKTNSKNVNEPKLMDESPVCDLFKAISSNEQLYVMEEILNEGIGWGDVKEITFGILNNIISDARLRYDEMEGVDFKSERKYGWIREMVRHKMKKIKKLVY